MTDINVFRERYKSFTDSKLRVIAKEAYTLPSEIQQVLEEELKQRGLNDVKIEYIDPSQEPDYMTQIVNGIAFEVPLPKESHIYDDADEQEFEEDEIPAQKMPYVDYDPNEFLSLIFKKCEYTLDLKIALFVIFSFSLFLLYWGIKTSLFFLIILAGLVAYFGYRLLTSRSKSANGGELWVDMIENNPENIVWIKPIIERTSYWYLITISKEHQLQILTQDGQSVIIFCDNDYEGEIFFDGIKYFLPNVHVGYSFEIEEMYKSNPSTFIYTLKKNRIYLPARNL
jgi:hypothetical protein